MHEDLWVACDLTYDDGRVDRFAHDEKADADRPHSFNHSSQIPGGWHDASTVLPRPANLRADDAALFSSGRFYTAGSKTLYEGRIAGIPQVGVNEIRLEFEGWSAALDDDETFSEIFVDRDFSHWVPMSVERRLALTPTWSIFDAAVLTDITTGQPALELDAQGAWALKPTVEAWYDSGPLGIESVYGAWKINANIISADTNWQWHIYLLSHDTAGGSSADSGDLRAAGPGTGIVTSTGVDDRFAVVQLTYNTVPAGSDGASHSLYWTCLAVYGKHGLTKRGTASATEAQGFLASDMIAHALGRACPDLNFTLGDSIETSPFPIIHFAPRDRGTVRQNVVEPLTALSANVVPNDWGVYDNREFFHKTPGTYGRTWRVRKDKIATLTSSGPSGKDRTGGMFISYQDGTGKTHSVGPPGSGADFESADLLDTDPQNPASRLGRRIKHRQAGILNQEQALNVGRFLLHEANRVDWQGTIDLKGEITDDAGNKHHPGEMKAGDRIVTEDEEYPEERNIIMTSANQDDLSVKVDIGAPPNRGDVMFAQLAAATERIA